MADREAEPLTYVPETVLKKRKDTEQAAVRRREQSEARKAHNKENRKLQFKRAEQFIKEYRLQELDRFRLKRNKKLQKDRFRLKRNKKLQKSSFTKSDSRLIFVTRIGGTNDMHLKTKKILRLLHLRKICTGVFIILNEHTAKLLKLVEPYVTYGYPNLKSVTELIFKKGVGWLNNERVPLTDNSVIEQALGKYGIICAEDIIHEISSVGSHFKDVSNFLQPFKLSAPDGGFQKIKKIFNDGGDAGNREDRINDLIRRMN